MTGKAGVQKNNLFVYLADQMHDGVIRMEIGEEEVFELFNNSHQPSHGNIKVGPPRNGKIKQLTDAEAAEKKKR